MEYLSCKARYPCHFFGGFLMGLKPSVTIKWIQKKDPTCIIFPECTPDVVMAITVIYQSDSHYTT